MKKSCKINRHPCHILSGLRSSQCYLSLISVATSDQMLAINMFSGTRQFKTTLTPFLLKPVPLRSPELFIVSRFIHFSSSGICHEKNRNSEIQRLRPQDFTLISTQPQFSLSPPPAHPHATQTALKTHLFKSNLWQLNLYLLHLFSVNYFR